MRPAPEQGGHFFSWCVFACLLVIGSQIGSSSVAQTTLEIHHVGQDGFELMILLTQPPQCWDHSHSAPCLAHFLAFNQYISHSLFWKVENEMPA